MKLLSDETRRKMTTFIVIVKFKDETEMEPCRLVFKDMRSVELSIAALIRAKNVKMISYQEYRWNKLKEDREVYHCS